eukprot:363289-Chlamydomonas_euryale.AAC.2
MAQPAYPDLPQLWAKSSRSSPSLAAPTPCCPDRPSLAQPVCPLTRLTYVRQVDLSSILGRHGARGHLRASARRQTFALGNLHGLPNHVRFERRPSHRPLACAAIDGDAAPLFGSVTRPMR